MKKLLLVVLLLILMSGCSQNNEIITPDTLKALVARAAAGSETADDSLAGLFSLSSLVDYSPEIHIDTVSINAVKYFAVCIKVKEDTGSMLAVYDQFLNCYLVDKSLNGSLKLQAKNEPGFGYFALQENFFSNDSIELHRFSMYRGDTSGFNLSFRTFTMMKTADTVFIHNLYEISREKIRTNITAPVFSGLNNFYEEYPYDIYKNIYDVQKSIYFDEFVTGFISSVKDTVNKFLNPLGNKAENEVSALFMKSGYVFDYYLSLDENWKELRNISHTGILKRELTGSKFINEKLNSDIHVFLVPFAEQTETYINAELKYKVKGYYIVRYSDDYITGEMIRKYFEYECNTKKYLLILSAFRDTYADHKPEYYEIINTFYINC